MRKNIISRWLPTSSLVLAMVATATAERGEQTITVYSDGTPKANEPSNIQKRVIVKKVGAGEEKDEKVEIPYLGVSTEEPS